MEYICLGCGHIFEDGEEMRWTEKHGLENGPYEQMTGCPICSDGYVEAAHCCSCGKATLEYNLFGGYCLDCLTQTITCDTALQYFEDAGCLDQFMFEKYFGCPAPKQVSELLHKTLREWFLRMFRDNQIRGVNEMRDLCVEFILVDDCEYGCDEYANWLRGKADV